jgi:hypothetical protein
MNSSHFSPYLKAFNVSKDMLSSKLILLGMFLFLSGQSISQLDFEPLFGVDQKKKALYELLTYGQGNFGVAVDRLQVKKILKPTPIGQIDSLLSIQYSGFGRKKVYKLFYNEDKFVTVVRRKNTLVVNYNIYGEINYTFALNHADSFTQVLVKTKGQKRRTKMNSPDIAYKWNGKKYQKKLKDTNEIELMEEVYHRFFVPFEPLTKK